MILNSIVLTIAISVLGSTDSSPKSEWMPLCLKVEKADLVFEATFEVPKKELGAEGSLAEAVVKRGKISRIIKGQLALGTPWATAFGNPFEGYMGGYLEKLLEGRTHIQRVVFLKKREGGYTPIAGAEAQLGCQRSSHISWCPSYVDYRKQAEACIACLEQNPGKYPRCY